MMKYNIVCLFYYIILICLLCLLLCNIFKASIIKYVLIILFFYIFSLGSAFMLSITLLLIYEDIKQL